RDLTRKHPFIQTVYPIDFSTSPPMTQAEIAAHEQEMKRLYGPEKQKAPPETPSRPAAEATGGIKPIITHKPPQSEGKGVKSRADQSAYVIEKAADKSILPDFDAPKKWRPPGKVLS